jgi:predicted dehydrogenase
MKKIKVGLVGVGRLGSMYADFLMNRVPAAELVAVADLIPERASGCAEKYGVSAWYDNHHDLNHDSGVEAVIVTATTQNHKEIVLDAAGTKKPIFCEKPLTLNLPDAREMRNRVEEKGIFFQMGFQRRFDKAFAGAKRKIDEGVIGRPVVFRGSSRDPYPPSLEYLKPENSGGQILDMAIHDIDIARWYMGDMDTVHAVGDVLAYPEIRQTGDTDNVIMVVTFRNGGLGEIDISRNGIYGYDIRAEVLGTEGAVQAGYLRETPLLVMTKQGVSHDVVPYFPERFGDAYVNQLNNFLTNLIESRPPAISIDEGIAALQVGVAATDALGQKTTVRISDY